MSATAEAAADIVLVSDSNLITCDVSRVARTRNRYVSLPRPLSLRSGVREIRTPARACHELVASLLRHLSKNPQQSSCRILPTELSRLRGAGGREPHAQGGLVEHGFHAFSDAVDVVRIH